MPKPGSEQAVVITEESTGIGRATMLKFAEHGAKVVCAARSKGGADGWGTGTGRFTRRADVAAAPAAVGGRVDECSVRRSDG